MLSNIPTIDGKCYGQMLIGGAASLAAHVEQLNSLNVFPVSDGDTGTNMLRTMEGGIAQLEQNDNISIGQALQTFARGILLSARGNSGVILSQIFAGIGEGLSQYNTVTAQQLAQAYEKGIEKSYAAVQNPTEGTILTVFRESTCYASERMTENSTVEEFFRAHIEKAKKSLEETTNRLPVLKEAGVVDSGAAGYLYIAEGMYQALTGTPVTYEVTQQQQSQQVNIDLFTRDSVLEFGYCTEFLLRLTTAKVDPDRFCIDTVLSVLKEMGGESVVAYQQGDIVKVHVHTFTPGEVLARMQQYGEFLTVKIENMALGHSESEQTKQKPKNNRKFSVVAVASGEGMAALFTQMGVDRVIHGGQTANPSIEEFVEAFKKCDTEHIFVLPNNKNILLAAQQAAQLYQDAVIHVIETKSMMQGYSALSVLTPGITDIQALISGAKRAADSVVDGEVTMAVRDAAMDGFQIHTGEYIAISGGKIVAVAENAEEAMTKMLETMDTDLCEIITLFVGKNVTDQRRADLTEQLKRCYDECEIVVYEGGQDVYDYLVGVE